MPSASPYFAFVWLGRVFLDFPLARRTGRFLRLFRQRKARRLFLFSAVINKLSGFSSMDIVLQYCFYTTRMEKLHYRNSSTVYRLLVFDPSCRLRFCFFTSPVFSRLRSAASTVFLSIQHSSAISRRDGKQTPFLSLCFTRQQ